MPYVMSKSSIIPGIIGILIAGIYAFIMSLFVVYTAEETHQFEFSNLLSNIWFKRIAAAFIIVDAGSICLSIIVLIGDLVTQGLHGISDTFIFEYDRTIYIIIVGILIIPLTLLKNLKSLQFSSLILYLRTYVY